MMEERSPDFKRWGATLEHARRALRIELVATIGSDRCRCGSTKPQDSTPFCKECFSSLPRDMRKAWKWIYRNYQYWERPIVKARGVLARGTMTAADLLLDSLTDDYVAEYDRCLDFIAARRRGEVIHRRKEEMEEIEVPA